MKNIIMILVLNTSLYLAGCEQVFFEDQPDSDPKAVFDHFWETYNSYYANFDTRNINWDQVYNDYNSIITDNTSEEELYSHLTDILTQMNDGHVTLTAPDKIRFDSNVYYRDRINFDLFNLDVIKGTYLDEGFHDTKYEVLGNIDSDITYLHLSDIGPESMSMIDEAIANAQNSKGIIIDLRHNFGGNFIHAFKKLGQFNDARRLIFSSRTKNGAGLDDFDPWFDWFLEANQSFGKPLAILCDRYTISAAERVLLIFKALPQAKIIGDTTNGALSNMIGRQLSNGWHVSLATQQVRDGSGKNIEGLGIIPDMVVSNTETGIENNIDNVLAQAIAHIRDI